MTFTALLLLPFHTTLLSVGLIYMLIISIVNTLQDLMKINRDKRAAEMGSEKKTPVVALTANAILGAREMYLSEGFDEFLTKPIQARALEDMIRNIMIKG